MILIYLSSTSGNQEKTKMEFNLIVISIVNVSNVSKACREVVKDKFDFNLVAMWRQDLLIKVVFTV